MRPILIVSTLIGLLLLAIAGCGGSSEAEAVIVPAALPKIDPANFVDSQVIDNPYFPLKPGTTAIYDGTEEDDTVHIEEFVTHETRQIMGVTAVVVRVREWINGELAEDTVDWYAQDREGNVWYFGELSKEYEDGEFVGTEGSWEAGVDGATAGIIMKANPQVGDAYRQEYLPGEAEDMGEVIRLNESTSVPFGSFEGVVVILEWNPLEPDVLEYDYYARGVGAILEEVVEGEAERIELVAIRSE